MLATYAYIVGFIAASAGMISCAPAVPNLCTDHGGTVSELKFTDRGGNSVTKTKCGDGTQFEDRVPQVEE